MPQQRKLPASGHAGHCLVDRCKCQRCHTQMYKDDTAVYTAKGNEKNYWHPECFRCAKCDLLLSDLVYFMKNGQLLCRQHVVDVFCNRCKQAIMEPEYAVAQGQAYHMKHFCCNECFMPLGGHRFMCRHNQPYCLTCFVAKYEDK